MTGFRAEEADLGLGKDNWMLDCLKNLTKDFGLPGPETTQYRFQTFMS